MNMNNIFIPYIHTRFHSLKVKCKIMQTQHFCPKAFQGIYLNAEKYLLERLWRIRHAYCGKYRGKKIA